MNWAETIRAVMDRAEDRCEYCRMHQALQGATFHLEHIWPRSHGGSSEMDNLAWACRACNLAKSDRVDVTDPLTDEQVSLFNPRTDDWAAHFAWEGYQVIGLSAVGRAAIAALDFNSPRRLLIRRAEELFDLFPPE